LCKACLAVLLVIGFIVDAMASEQQGHQSETDRNPLSDIEFDDTQSPHFLNERP
jgi:hypothetical protein